MPVFNYAGQEINAKIVYYGPGLCGKTTNLEFIYAKLPRENKGKMVSMKTRTDRTLFFDFLPIDIGEINGMKVRFLLYTVPGQVYYNATRKLVLKGVDALVFVADSARDRMQDNKESLQNLEDNLNDLGMTLREIPWVLQINKRDLPSAVDRATAERELNALSVPSFEAVANKGNGVYETLEGIAKLVLRSMQDTMREPEPPGESRGQSGDHRISAEVVAKGKRPRGAHADEEDYRYDEAKPYEDRSSVSEVVDVALSEKRTDAEGVDLGATRGGYEEYGHVVELSGEENGGKKASVEAPRQQGEILNADPLQGLAEASSEPAPAAKTPPPPVAKKAADREAAAGDRSAEKEAPRQSAAKGTPARAGEIERKTIRVPVRLSKTEANKEIELSVLLEIEVE